MVSKNKELKESSNLLIVGIEVCTITEPSFAAFLNESLNYFASSLTKYDLSILCYTQFFFCLLPLQKWISCMVKNKIICLFAV